jgi:hypothetical protein
MFFMALRNPLFVERTGCEFQFPALAVRCSQGAKCARSLGDDKENSRDSNRWPEPMMAIAEGTQRDYPGFESAMTLPIAGHILNKIDGRHCPDEPDAEPGNARFKA